MIAGCASPSDTGAPARKERVSDAYVPTGTLIRRKKTERTANTTAVDGQAYQDEQMNGSDANNGTGR